MDNFISEDTKLAVKRGIVWLDENHPGWENRLDLDELKMEDCEVCVIGQAVGSYWEVMDTASGGGIDNGVVWAKDHGFDAEKDYTDYSSDDETWNIAQEYRNLEILWTDEVKRRLG